MNEHWIDVSMPLHAGMARWPGDPPFELTPCSRMAAGDSCNTSQIGLSAHAGTHVDAPWHFVEGGKRVHELDPSLFFGDALVVDALDVDMVTADCFGPDPLPARILIRTRNSLQPETGEFVREYVGLHPSAAQRLAADDVRMVGVDYLSVGPFDDPYQSQTHRILLEREVFVVEGLRLTEAAAGPCEFTVLPLPIVGADGAPCRAFLRPV